MFISETMTWCTFLILWPSSFWTTIMAYRLFNQQPWQRCCFRILFFILNFHESESIFIDNTDIHIASAYYEHLHFEQPSRRIDYLINDRDKDAASAYFSSFWTSMTAHRYLYWQHWHSCSFRISWPSSFWATTTTYRFFNKQLCQWYIFRDL
jgi:hypothetical protein